LIETSVVAQILSLAITRLPNNDFVLALYLLSEHVVSDPAIKCIVDLHTHLQENRYPEFWKTLKGHSSISKSVKDFDKDVRDYIARTIGITFNSIELPLVEKYVNLNGDELRKWMKARSWAIAGSTVTLPSVKENQAHSYLVQETIDFEQLTKIIARSNEK
jgi:translation initiation factor 3 subunit K